jgi:two-component system LytT family response regulator
MTPPKLKTLIVDDEPLARQTVRRLLEADAGIEVVGECGDGRSALKAITTLRPDLVYLDIRMPGLSGMKLLAQLKPAERPAVIFATAYDEFAREAFDLLAVDYLLKPFSDARFAQSLARAKERMRRPASRKTLDTQVDSLLELFARRESGAEPKLGYTSVLPFKVGFDRHLLRLCDVRWIESQSDYVRVHATKQSVLIRGTMNHLQERLPADKFVRIHRSAIVNIDYVKRLRSVWSGDWALELDDGTRLRASRNYREQLEKLMPHDA